MIVNNYDLDNTCLINDAGNTDLVGLYFYYLNEGLMKDGGEAKNTGIFNNNSGYIQNVSYNPFLEPDDLTLYKSNFDTTKHADITNEPTSVYRIAKMSNVNKTIGSLYLHAYEDEEPILDAYPYTYYMLYDGFNPPMVIKPQYLNDAKTIQLKVKTGVNQTSKYLLYCVGYKGDYEGNLEGIVNEHPMILPVGSTAYAQFLATSNASFNANQRLGLMENEINYSQNKSAVSLDNLINDRNHMVSQIGNGISAIKNVVSFATGNKLGGIVGLVDTGYNAYSDYVNYQNRQMANDLQSANIQQNYEFSEYAQETRAMATITDLKKTPRAMQSTGNDMLFNMQKADKKIMLYKYTITDKNKERLRMYYKKYGYLVNNYINNPNLHTRRYYNFIKMGKCELKGDNVPKICLEEIKGIFESGITFWHVDNGVEMCDYSVDN